MPVRLLRVVRQRLRALFRKDALDAELEGELAFHLEQLVQEFVEGHRRPAPPRLVGVMLEPVGRRHPKLVGDAHPSQHVAVGVGGYRLDRRAADVDADCDAFA